MITIWTKVVKENRTAPPAPVAGAMPLPDRRTIYISTTGQTITPSQTGGLPTVTGGVQHTYSMQYSDTAAPSSSVNIVAQCYQVDGQYLVPINGVLADFTELPMDWPQIDKATFDAQQATRKLI